MTESTTSQTAGTTAETSGTTTGTTTGTNSGQTAGRIVHNIAASISSGFHAVEGKVKSMLPGGGTQGRAEGTHATHSGPGSVPGKDMTGTQSNIKDR